ncbi:MAG TPA: hypothetical protein EYN51_07390 [Flavobacteriales bacterium]|nr:hypothetical protein [Flavobacteriales bacterium]HIA12044.1 hypothetical protein [Flavobacteriales bacterium]
MTQIVCLPAVVGLRSEEAEELTLRAIELAKAQEAEGYTDTEELLLKIRKAMVANVADTLEGE